MELYHRCCCMAFAGICSLVESKFVFRCSKAKCFVGIFIIPLEPMRNETYCEYSNFCSRATKKKRKKSRTNAQAHTIEASERCKKSRRADKGSVGDRKSKRLLYFVLFGHWRCPRLSIFLSIVIAFGQLLWEIFAMTSEFGGIAHTRTHTPRVALCIVHGSTHVGK